MKKIFVAIVAFALTVTTTAQAMPNSGQTRSQGDDAVSCAGSTLVIDETDPVDGSVLRASLGGFSAQRSDNTVRVLRGDELVLTFEVPEAAKYADIAALVSAVKTLKDLCVMHPRDRKIFDQLAALTILPGLRAAGISLNFNLAGSGYAEGFLVVFVLLVIVAWSGG